MNQKKYLTVPEAAEISRIPTKTIYYWIAIGKLPSTRPGRRRLIREDVLIRFLDGKDVPRATEGTKR